MSETATNQPAIRFSCGAVSVAVWRREHNGKNFYSASPQRAFTKDEGKTWEYTTTFDRNDIPVIAELLRHAFQWILSKPQ